MSSYYELHITVSVSDIDLFKSISEAHGIKTICINKENGDPLEPMTSIPLPISMKPLMYEEVLCECAKYVKVYEYGGCEIVRVKLERFANAVKHPCFLYYEVHLKLDFPNWYSHDDVQKFSESKGFHLSKNEFKKQIISRGVARRFLITYRSSTQTLSEFEYTIESFMTAFKKNFSIGHAEIFEKYHMEECILDTNKEIDDNWLKVISNVKK